MQFNIYETLASFAVIIAIITGIVKFTSRSKKNIRKRKLIKLARHFKIWDVEINRELNDRETTVARLIVKAKTLEETKDRALYLIMEWNQIKLGFSWPMNQTLPYDDESKPIEIIKPELLPQKYGSSEYAESVSAWLHPLSLLYHLFLPSPFPQD